MEHVKLARRDARRRAEGRHRGPRGWAVAASMALGATCAFVGVALWLGMNGAKSNQVRTQAPHLAGRSRQRLPPMMATVPATPPPLPEPSTNHPRTKKRRGQVQKVRPEVNVTTPRTTTSTSTSTTSTSTISTSTTTTSTTTSTTTPSPPALVPEAPAFVPEAPAFVPEAPAFVPEAPAFVPETPASKSEVPVLGDVEIRGPSEQDVYFPKLDAALEDTFRDVLQDGALTPPPPPPPPPPPTQPPSQPPSTQPPVIPQSRHPLLPFRHDFIHDDRDPLLAPPPPPYPYEVLETENPFLALVRDRIDATQNWLSSVGAGKDWMELAGAVNESFHVGDVAPALAKLSQMYRETTVSSAHPPSELSDPSSLASLGLLAFDVLLLRNVQLLARSEEGPSGDVARELFRDREVRALGALFMPPREARRLMEDRADSPASSDGAVSVSNAPNVGDPADASEDDDEDRELTLGDVVREVSSFVTSAVRAVLNVGRAYRRSLTFGSGKAVSARKDDSRTPLDCMWTLYCRNLDKTARLTGPYGFLAKLNGLGLRLLLNAVPLDQAVDVLVKEAANGWGHIDCETLFPRCSADEAVPAVLRTALAGPSLL